MHSTSILLILFFLSSSKALPMLGGIPANHNPVTSTGLPRSISEGSVPGNSPGLFLSGVPSIGGSVLNGESLSQSSSVQSQSFLPVTVHSQSSSVDNRDAASEVSVISGSSTPNTRPVTPIPSPGITTFGRNEEGRWNLVNIETNSPALTATRGRTVSMPVSSSFSSASSSSSTSSSQESSSASTSEYSSEYASSTGSPSATMSRSSSVSFSQASTPLQRSQRQRLPNSVSTDSFATETGSEFTDISMRTIREKPSSRPMDSFTFGTIVQVENRDLLNERTRLLESNQKFSRKRNPDSFKPALSHSIIRGENGNIFIPSNIKLGAGTQGYIKLAEHFNGEQTVPVVMKVIKISNDPLPVETAAVLSGRGNQDIVKIKKEIEEDRFSFQALREQQFNRERSALEEMKMLVDYARVPSGEKAILFQQMIPGEKLSSLPFATMSKEEMKQLETAIIDAVNDFHLKTGRTHRDLKPDNILVTMNPFKAHLIDFGMVSAPSQAVKDAVLRGSSDDANVWYNMQADIRTATRGVGILIGRKEAQKVIDQNEIEKAFDN